ncbi:MAG: hypothetical protein H7832_00305 [Magnetococcus sp. DMHC-6]
MGTPIREQCEQHILSIAQGLLASPLIVTLDTPLIGRDSPFKSRQLVELLVAVEEFCDETLSVTFDWTSDSALSENRSVYRTLETLVAYIVQLTEGR